MSCGLDMHAEVDKEKYVMWCDTDRVTVMGLQGDCKLPESPALIVRVFGNH